MALQNFIDNSLPTIKAAFLNGIDILKTTIFDDATTKPAARTALGATTVGDAVFIAVDEAAARTAIGAAASGPLASSGITGAAASGANTDITTLGALTGINGTSINGQRNKLINGNFNVNQRAYVSGAALGAGVYGFDRWKAGAGGCTLTFSTTANVTTVTITAGTLVQVVEGANLQSGTHVLSWAGTAQGRINGGTYGASGAVTATATGGTDMTVEFNTGTLSKTQLEFGAVASVFEQRLYGFELELCQRYCELLAAVQGCDAVGFTSRISYVFSTPKYSTTTVTLAGGSSGTVSSITTRGFQLGVASGAGTPTIVGGSIAVSEL